MKGRPVAWSAGELAWIEARADLPRRDLHARFVARFGRADVSLSNIAALCKRRGWRAGRTGRFAPGCVPHNAGRKGFCAPGSEKGWFRAGERRGAAARLWQPVGTERLTADGYVERKVNDDLPARRRWRAVHLIRWVEQNGPLPEGHALKCLDGNRANTDPANWICVPRAVLPRLNGKFGRDFDAAPASVKPAILATTLLEHAAREARKTGKETDR